MKDLYKRVNYITKIHFGSAARCAEVLGMKRQTFHRYLNQQMQGHLWELLPAILEYYPLIRRDWLYFGEGETYKNQKNDTHANLNTYTTNNDIDNEILSSVVSTLEEMLETSKKHLPLEAKSEVICQLYQILADIEEDKTQKPSKMLKVMNEAISQAI